MFQVKGKSVLPEVAMVVVLVASTVPFMTSTDILSVVGCFVTFGLLAIPTYFGVRSRFNK